MEETVDSIRSLSTSNSYSDGTTPAFICRYAVTPAWIHDFLSLWERNLVLSIYLEKALDRVAEEIHSTSIRRQTLYQITYDFVPITNQERRQRTISPNIWAAYSKLYSSESLTPAYLVNIIAGNAVANAVNGLIHRYTVAGDTISLRDVRPYLVSRFGDRGPIRASASAVLRTLAGFGVLTPLERAGDYRINSRLQVEAYALPLLVYAWWRLRKWRDIRLDDFAQDTLMTLIDTDSCVDAWQHYEGMLWTMSKHNSPTSAKLRATDEVTFLRLLLNALASHPHWSTVSRELLHPAENR